MNSNLHPVFFEICESIKRGSGAAAQFTQMLNGIDSALGFQLAALHPSHCTIEHFTAGGRVSQECGGTEDLVICIKCGSAICKPCRANHPVCAVAGEPVCETCLYPDADNFELWEN